ncbi:MAG: OmpA family protein [Bacteroidota bacterium]
MKKVTLLFIAIVFCASVGVAQNADNRWGWSHLLNLNHYDGVGGSEILNLGEASLGYQTGFHYYINQSFNATLNLGVDGIDFERIDESTGKAFLALDYKFNNGTILPEDAFVKPYITAGFGIIEQLDKGEPLYPIGAGVRFGVADDVDVQVQGVFNYVANGDRPVNYNFFQLGAGIVFNIGAASSPKDSDGDGVPDKEDICPKEAGPSSNNGCPLPPDADGDGVVDSEDKCPNEVGPASNGGCPLPKDSDGDGVIDDEDSCPNVSGSAALNGCPDSDGDGVADKDDACPRVAGLASLNGCPDSDGDGIADKDDKCINEAGPTSNNGCPELEEEEKAILLEALEGVQFETGKAVIKSSSYGKLDNVVGLLNKHKDFKLKISGYTDNTGNADKNLTLSDARAKAAKQYIVDKGIGSERITAEGYGIANPVATNDTAAGRAKNRRVEFEIIQ